MKKCTVCNQTYTDENLNFCLNDGSTLVPLNEEPAATVFMTQPQPTNPNNWSDSTNNSPFASPQTGFNPPPMFDQSQPSSSPWQGAPLSSNQPFAVTNPAYAGQDKTLPTVSLALGVAGLCLFCCYGGILFGVPAMITGFLGMNNTNKNPQQYGGRNLAIAGLALGGISFLINLLWMILVFGR